MDRLLQDESIGFEIVVYLEKSGRLDLIPAMYSSQAAISQLQLKSQIKNNTNDKPKHISLIEIKKHKLADKKGMLYIYEVIYENEKGRYIAINGLQPKNQKEINYEACFFAMERQYLGQDLDRVIEQMINNYHEESTEGWESEYGIEN